MKISDSPSILRAAVRAKLILTGITCFGGVVLSVATPIESSISSTNQFAYSSNAGWINFRPNSENGAQVHENLLCGYAYAANFGWIHFGDGSPDNGHKYSNNSSTDYGINLNADGSLEGKAFAPNIGWVSFEKIWGQPRINYSTGRFSGFAYSGNIGWISLDTEFSDLVTSYIAIPVDNDGEGIPDSWEMENFGDLTTARTTTDYDGDGVTDSKEYLAGTDPKDPQSQFRVVYHSYNTANSSSSITFTSVKNRLYRIEHDSDLQGSWADSGLGLIAASPETVTSRTFTYPNSSRFFFRVQAIKPLQK
jgi:hypothetical protein